MREESKSFEKLKSHFKQKKIKFWFQNYNNWSPQSLGKEGDTTQRKHTSVPTFIKFKVSSYFSNKKQNQPSLLRITYQFIKRVLLKHMYYTINCYSQCSTKT